jgi:hypothetical protein
MIRRFLQPVTPMTRPLCLIALAALAALGCSDSTSSGGDNTRPADSLSFLQLAASAPALCADSIGFWAVQGHDAEGALTFPSEDNRCPDGEDFVRLKIKGQSLLARPDGSPILPGDSVFISIKWVGNDSLLFQLQPSGLKFRPDHPAELTMTYAECGDDLNRDGEVDDEDTTVAGLLAIWRQETLLDPFQRLTSLRPSGEHRLEANLNGFSRYAIAY